MKFIQQARARRFMRTSFYRSMLQDLPPTLETAWRQSAPQEYPGIRTDAFFFARAAEGLVRFFDAVWHSKQPCALPSEAADSVWHAWLRHDPIGLERWCRKHFGQVIPHIEGSRLASGALAHTLMSGRAMEGIAPLGPRLPRLFELDALLRMPNGHGYWVRNGEIVYARLGRRGRCERRAQPHAALAVSALLAAGLVDAEMVLSHARLQHAAAGSSCGSSCGAFAGDAACADGGGGDGGGDGGSSCGSSCGGGCGGGD